MNCYDAIAATHGLQAHQLAEQNATVASHLVALHALCCRDDHQEKETAAQKQHKLAFHVPRKTAATGLAARLKAEMKQSFRTLGELGLNGIATRAISHLPPGAVILEFDFTLENKLVSRDESVFYPNLNPIRKDRLLRLPLTPGSTWKGNLRSAAVDNLLLSSVAKEERWNDRLRLIDIFGDEKGRDLTPPEIKDQAGKDKPLAAYLDDFAPWPVDRSTAAPASLAARQGRLQLMPAYYDRVDLDILNPRDRATRAGTIPIVIEVVPTGAAGRFGIIYLPFDLIGKAGKDLAEELSNDWKLIGEAVFRMFRVSGFGAKKSSGCGKARATISGFRFECRLPGFRPAVATSFGDIRNLHLGFGAAR